MKPSICIVAPSYNHEEFIEQCLESIVIQSHDDYWIDLVIIDDASTDDTANIIRNFIGRKEVKKSLRNIEFIENAHNCGAHRNYNKAISKVQSDLIHFINTDDWLSPNRISSVVKLYNSLQDVKQKEYFWGFARVFLTDEAGVIISGERLLQYVTHVIDYSVRHMPSVSFHLLRDNLTISTGNIFSSTHLAKMLGGFNNYK